MHVCVHEIKNRQLRDSVNYLQRSSYSYNYRQVRMFVMCLDLLDKHLQLYRTQKNHPIINEQDETDIASYVLNIFDYSLNLFFAMSVINLVDIIFRKSIAIAYLYAQAQLYAGIVHICVSVNRARINYSARSKSWNLQSLIDDCRKMARHCNIQLPYVLFCRFKPCRHALEEFHVVRSLGTY